MLLFFIAAFLFFSCEKNNEPPFSDDQIGFAMDFKTDPQTGDTIYQIYLPNAFTPNGDGINDLYSVYGKGIQQDDFSLCAFERNGDLVYKTDDPNDGWTGHIFGSGTIMPETTYNVQISAKDTTGDLHEYNYKILLVR